MLGGAVDTDNRAVSRKSLDSGDSGRIDPGPTALTVGAILIDFSDFDI
jgi:hypothetical protein